MTEHADQTAMPMTFAAALGESLRRTAYFAETHAIKGVLAADRLARRHAALGDRFFADAVRLWQILPAPAVTGAMRRHVHWAAPLDDARVEGAIGRAVFPLAYEAAGVWVERRGLASLVERYRRRAIARLGHLGHSWTIWCSFHEVLARLPEVAPPLTNRDAEILCGERFVEPVAAQLAYNAPEQPDPDLQPLDGPPPDEASTLDAALSWPGFFGHTLITLGYLHRHRGLLDDAAWRWAMARVRELAAQRTGAAAQAVATAAPALTAGASEAEVDAAVVRLALEGPREVHAITLADAAHDLAAVATPRQRAHLVAALAAVARWDPST